MKCTNCGFENSVNLEFCNQCGKPREAALRFKNNLIGILVVMGVAVVMGLLGFQLVHIFSDIMRQLP